ncbi:site-specific DNA-methyltransferase [Paraglaciecola chathamensis]|uniref:Methyltransferase n=1 Tax=Paraglaciecola chathamensis TaxID=368405 RepID=A0ABS0WHG6_9ALTE|nr:site-specific DNA-methyltransferase [Paraglaciecola chathamensis]MBJ2137914.1 site-specific DNA-methyltransferase [Paraglaciecola chathamensis]
MEINDDHLANIKRKLEQSIKVNGIAILPPMDVLESTELLRLIGQRTTVSMIDPWYNKGTGGVRSDYVEFVTGILSKVSNLSEHIYLWGFPEIAAQFVSRIPDQFSLTAWLTWYYKNNPSVIRGWRSSQQTCLHLSTDKAKLYPEHFLNDSQKIKLAAGKLRYIPGPTSVIESALNIGFIRKKEQTGHPAQKPENVYEKLLLMTMLKDQYVFDPMAGSGTTGAVAQKHDFKAILADENDDYISLMEKRLNTKRLDI